jgi:hypothetical protein
MPVVLRYKGYTFFFSRTKGSRVNHCISMCVTATAKFWLEPEVMLADSFGMKDYFHE